MKVVLDANVIISGTITPQGISGLILRAWRRQSFELCTSPGIVAEVSAALFHSDLAKRYALAEEDVTAVLEEIESLATMQAFVVECINLVRDPKDNMVIECAVACEADLIVTNDDDLLALKSYESIGIASIRDFVRTLGAT